MFDVHKIESNQNLIFTEFDNAETLLISEVKMLLEHRLAI